MTEDDKGELFGAMWDWRESVFAGAADAADCWLVFQAIASRHGFDPERRVLEDRTWAGACRELEKWMDKPLLRRMMESAARADAAP